MTIKFISKALAMFVIAGMCMPVKAQWVYKINSKGEERMVYEIPRRTETSTSATSIPVAVNNNAVSNNAGVNNAGGNIVAVDYAFSEGFTGIEEYMGNGKWGFMRNVYLEKAEGDFQEVRKFREGMAGVKLNNKWGFADRTRMAVITPVYDDISYFSEGLAAVSLNNKYGFIDKTGKVVIPIEYDDVIGLFDAGKIAVTKNEETFYINNTGQKVQADYKSDPYNYPSYFAYGVTAVKIWDRWAFYNEEGKLLTNFIYSDVIAFSEGLAGVKINNKWGFVDINGKEVIAPEYDEVAASFDKGVAVVVKGTERYGIDKNGKRVIAELPLDGRYGFIGDQIFPLLSNYDYDISTDKPVDWQITDNMGKRVTPLKLVFSDGFSKVRVNGKWGFIDRKGNLAIPAEFDEVSAPFDKGTALVIKNGKQFKIDGSGKEVDENTTPKPVYKNYEYEIAYPDGLTWVSLGDKEGYIDSNRYEVIPLIYESLSSFSDGLASFTRDGLHYGFIDKKGNEVIPDDYESVTSFAEGLGGACITGRGCGFIDKRNNIIIPFEYGEVKYFREGLAAVSLKNFWGFVDVTGKVVIPIKYIDVGYFKNGYCAVSYFYKWGIINKKGEEIVPPIYDKVGDFINGKVEVTLKKKKFYLDETGNKVSQ